MLDALLREATMMKRRVREHFSTGGRAAWRMVLGEISLMSLFMEASQLHLLTPDLFLDYNKKAPTGIEWSDYGWIRPVIRAK